VLPAHPNGMTFSAYDCAGDLLASSTKYSVRRAFVKID